LGQMRFVKTIGAPQPMNMQRVNSGSAKTAGTASDLKQRTHNAT
jgi:hypothetical protein